jgi:hypothetical protein
MSETKTAPSAATSPTASPAALAFAEGASGKCEVCGNHYHRTFEVLIGGTRHVFDCFECAIERLAPRCAHCGCRVIGHGVEPNGVIYCCDHCSRTTSVA